MADLTLGLSLCGLAGACLGLAWWLERRRARQVSQWAWRELAALPDEQGLFYPAEHPLAGRSRRARVTRPGFDVPDMDKLTLTPKPSARVLRMEKRR